MITKADILQVVKKLPSTASVEMAMEQLYLFYKIEKGLEQSKKGKTISHDEAKKKLNKWLK